MNRSDSDRKRVLDVIERAWAKYPYLRFGQLIENISNNTYYIEDDDLIEAFKKYEAENPTPELKKKQAKFWNGVMGEENDGHRKI